MSQRTPGSAGPFAAVTDHTLASTAVTPFT